MSTLYANEPQVRLAEKLAQITPGRLEKSFFTNSGTEANETAVLLAQIHTKCQDIITLRHSYSGRSYLALSLSAQSSWRLMPNVVPGVHHIANAYCYRCPFGLTYPSCDLKCAKDAEEAIQTMTSQGRVAAFLAEPIQGVGGFIVPPKEYFKEIVGIIKKYGGLFIADEVQTGWGRTGGKMFGIEHWGVDPDIMTFAKGMANGVPIGATIATPEVADSMHGNTISTFGGNPVSCASALATLRLLQGGLTEATNRWCEVNHVTFESVKQPGIHVLGDATTGLPVPKSGNVANATGKICATAIVHLLNGKEPPVLAPGNTCYSWVSDREAIAVVNAYRIDAGKVVQIEQKLTPRPSVAVAQNSLAWRTSIWNDILG